MARHIECPSCGECDDLDGHQTPEGIAIRCGRCSATWLRDSVATKCATCGGTDVEERTRALTQYSRGTQLSIVGLGAIFLCRRCDAKMMKWAESGKPVPFAYRSAAMYPLAGASRDDNSDVDITP